MANNTMRFDAISYLTHLESFQFSDSDSRIIQPLLSINTPLKIKTLVIVEFRSEVDKQLLHLLIQKIGSYIEILALKIYGKEFIWEIFVKSILHKSRNLIFSQELIIVSNNSLLDSSS